MPRKKPDKVVKKLGRRQARAVARPVAPRMKAAEPVADAEDLSMCRAGKHPVNRKIGTGCAACGSVSAWRS